MVLEGDVVSPIDPPPGCRFALRCSERIGACKEEEPPLVSAGEGHLVACHVRGHC
jgi:oligopeptide/dipeptide ABC transporter ATP-binding protein